MAKDVRKNLETYHISKAGELIYHFVWDEFCDWYLEIQKVTPNPQFLAWLYLEILGLVHPLCPFVTDTIYQEFWGNGESLMNRDYPKFDFQESSACELFTKIQNIVSEIRKVRAEKKLNPKDKISVKIKASMLELAENEAILKSLANLSNLEFDENSEKPERSVVVLVDGIEIFVEIPFDQAAEKARLTKERDELKNKIAGLQNRLSNKSYIEKAPEHLVNQTKEQLKGFEAELEKVEENLENMNEN